MPTRTYRDSLRRLHACYHRREFVHPDPLEFLYQYEDPRDREIVGLIASSLAYGNVVQILKSVAGVLARTGPPYRFVLEANRAEVFEIFRDFKHRFTTGQETATLLMGIRRVLEEHGSLRSCFARGLDADDQTVIPALSRFVSELSREFDGRPRSLLPSPDLGSACKRLHLYLRWMVRSDEVDPGGWDEVPRSKLVVPLDTHMHRISLALGLTRRKQGDIHTALEITSAFRSIEPDDPVRYDFCLTRLGIRRDLGAEEFLKDCSLERARGLSEAFPKARK